MNIAITTPTDRNLYVGVLIQRLDQVGLKPTCILSLSPTDLPRKLRGRVGELVRSRHGMAASLRFLSEHAHSHGLSVDPDLPALCQRLGIAYARAPSLSSPLAAEAMQHHRIDLLLNGGGGIFRRPLLESVKVGVLNPHMGRLPHYRGYNVMEWMVLAGEMPCSTLHFVDTGLDTGDILLHRPIRRDELPADVTLQGIRDRMGPVHVELLVEGVRRLVQGTLGRVTQTPEQGRQYFVMHAILRAQAEARLRRGDVRAVEDPAIPVFP